MKWLVEIRTKDWVPRKERVFTYEEVEAADEYYARHTGFRQFTMRLTEDIELIRQFESSGLTLGDLCAPDAVEI